MAQRQDAMLAELQRASGDLDQVIGELSLGTRSAAHFEALEEQAQAIARRIVQAVRGADAVPADTRITPGRNGGVWAS
jgi:hypothetical protein